MDWFVSLRIITYKKKGTVRVKIFFFYNRGVFFNSFLTRVQVIEKKMALCEKKEKYDGFD